MTASVTMQAGPLLRVTLGTQGPPGPRGGIVTVVTTATSATAAAQSHVEVTAAGQTITLPAVPTLGDELTIGVGAFSDTIVARNGSLISGAAADLTLADAGAVTALRYVGGAIGWRVL